jgi:cytolysin-activating lysine-acyltransferase
MDFPPLSSGTRVASAGEKENTTEIVATPDTAVAEENLLRLQQEDLAASAAFARIVSVLMRSPQHRHFALADLEWLVVPPVLSGQFAVLDAQFQGALLPIPTAVALWAFVSPEVDRRLSTELARPMRLRPDEWRSGDIAWLIEAVGPPAAMIELLRQLGASSFADKEVRMRVLGAEGRTAVVTLSSVVRGAELRSSANGACDA